MRLRTYYTCVVLIPIAILAAVAAGGGDDGSETLGLGPGGTVHWLVPHAAIRELVTYTAVALWLLWKLHRRPLAEFRAAIWRAPVLLVAVSVLFVLVPTLVNGLAREMVAEHGGRIVLRILVRLLVGFGYVGLAEWVGRQVESREAVQLGG
jgi:hypothetical protein